MIVHITGGQINDHIICNQSDRACCGANSMMKEYVITYFDPEVGRMLTQIIGTNDGASLIKSFKDRYDRVKVEQRTHWWYNNGSN